MNYNNWTQLNDPSVPQISGLEFFAGDNVALDIVKYMDSSEWHWMIRIWGTNGQCNIEASYDNGESGYALMSSCFESLMCYLENYYPELYNQLAPQKTSIVSSLIRKACEIGIAVLVSVSAAIPSLAAPAVAFAADDGGSYIEVADGVVCKLDVQEFVDAQEDSGLVIHDADITALANALSDGGVGYNMGSGYVTLEKDYIGYNNDHIIVILDSGQTFRVYNQEAVDAVAGLIGNGVFDFQRDLVRMDYIEIDSVPEYIVTYLETGELDMTAAHNAIANHPEHERGRTTETRLSLAGGAFIIALGLLTYAAAENQLHIKKNGVIVKTITLNELFDAIRYKLSLAAHS